MESKFYNNYLFLSEVQIARTESNFLGNAYFARDSYCPLTYYIRVSIYYAQVAPFTPRVTCCTTIYVTE